ncbi:hypothetical protein SDC9_190449 [bioreactor metagenome]|uniref:Uncharacterized protein n=1 Tax=bioreactor metagenome TaxID=1076179 RepID=A0A645HV08_9ZZZZ
MPEDTKKAAVEYSQIILLCGAPLRNMLAGSYAKAEANGDICIYTPKEVNVRFIDARKGEIESIITKKYGFKARVRIVFKEEKKKPKPEASDDAEFESLLKLIDVDEIE